MKLQLEKMDYQLRQAQEARRSEQIYFVAGDLESLSASVLYTGESCGRFAAAAPSRLYIKDLRDGSSLHMHEIDGKLVGANIRGRGEQSGSPITNYQAMMLDILPGRINIIDKD